MKEKHITRKTRMKNIKRMFKVANAHTPVFTMAKDDDHYYLQEDEFKAPPKIK